MRETPIELAEMTFEEARERIAAGAIALLPTGATEAHGPHLPLATDVVISREAARRAFRLLAREGVPAVVLPPLAYAVTEYASEFAGTISLPFETAKMLARDVILGATRTGLRGVVICNAHLEPENLRALREACDEARANGARVAFPDVTRKPHALRLGEEFKSGACHAGSYETSLVLAADPFLVRTARAEALAPNPTSLSRAIRDGKKTFIEAGGPSAYFGDPAAASAVEGEQLYAELADVFATAARELAST
ncbi:creatininase family protein [Sandaracinus amylolyticus]|uniref:Creatinine amidohydrolase n=1 Tax=Sandaracinus amylolyticus TaxID=927083 RepID=A0A0F6W7K4_9BACT|nr:creatininase family protein [Sandaracinus amylolyticus]AKF09531.1 Creatinine amidohydrolase [Sandaracinus amylolyticus]